MKKYKSIAKAVLLSCTLALTTSCNDFLDKAPDDQLTMEMIFTDKIRTEDWLAGVYLFRDGFSTISNRHGPKNSRKRSLSWCNR